MTTEARCSRSDVGKARKNEETRSLSPIEEESELTSRFHKSFGNFTINEPNRKGSKTVRYFREEYRRRLEKTTEGNEGSSSSEDERVERGPHQLEKVEGSYCFRAQSAVSKEAEASGDNDEAETGHRDKFPKTTVEQLKGRVSQLEREIVALKRRRRCQGHESCEKLWRDLLIWRDNHEKRIDAQIARWQMTERKRIHDETENTRTLYGGIQRHLDTLVRRSARSRLDFRRQIDVWEKQLKCDVLSLHENNLMELGEQFRAWFEVQNVINSPSARKERREMYKSSNKMALGEQNEPYKLDKLEATMSRDDVEFLRKIKRVIKFEVQQLRDDLAKRMDRKIAELWSSFEVFKYNFHLDRDYERHDYFEINDDKAESIDVENPSDFAYQESTKFDLNMSSEKKYIPQNVSVVL